MAKEIVQPNQGLQVKVLAMNDDVLLPTYANKGDACFDIRAYIDNDYQASDDQHNYVQDSRVFDTGLKFEIPEGYVMLVFSRSGHGFKNDVRLANCVGVIDSSYRGELKVKLTNDATTPMCVLKGDRIAQAMVLPVQQVYFQEVEELSETERGSGGFGSTGA